MAIGKRWTEQIEITVDGTLLPAETMGDLVDVIVENSLHLPDMFVIRLHDDEFTSIDEETFKPGAEVVIKLPMDEASETTHKVISGDITAVEPEFTEGLTTILVVRGYDRRHRLLRGTKTRVFIQMTDSDIVQKIASEAGFSVQAQSTSEVYDHVFQANESDLEFIYRLAHRNGYEIGVEDQTLHFRPPRGERASFSVEWGTTLRSFNPRLTLHDQVSEVTVKGWNPVQKKVILGKASSSSSSPSIGVGNTGVDAISTAFSSVKQVSVTHPVNSQQDADRLAQALLDELNAEYITAEGVAVGNPNFVAGSKLSISRIAAKFEGDYVVTMTRHLYTPEGYETFFSVEGHRPSQMLDLLDGNRNGMTINNDQAWSGVYIGIVTNNEDPLDMGRVKVKYPWLDDELESFWARTMHVGAGPERGLYWLPEINDEVLVSFEQGDFNRPYILGGLYNGQDKPVVPVGQAVQGGKVQIRTWKTRAGHELTFVDGESDQYIEIRDVGGKHVIKLDTKKQELTIDAQGKMKIASMGDVDISSNGNITIQASAQLNLKGSMINMN